MKWERPPIGRRALREMTASVTLVWRVVNGIEEPWVIVAESAALRSVRDGTEEDEGWGLYAWKDFKRDEEIARYEGEVVGEQRGYSERDEEGIAAALATLPAAKRDKVLEIATGPKSGRVRLVDGTSAGPPFLQRANDARGLSTPTARQARNTAIMEQDGRMQSLLRAPGERGTSARAWTQMTVNGDWNELMGREILWAYGPKYWGTAPRASKQAQNENASKGKEHQRDGAHNAHTSAQQAAAAARSKRAQRRREGEGGGEGSEEGMRDQQDETAAGAGSNDGNVPPSAGPASALHAVTYYEMGQATALACGATEGRGAVKTRVALVTEVIVANDRRRMGLAARMLERIAAEEGVQEIHLIVRTHAEQQEGARKLYAMLGFKKVDRAEEKTLDLPYVPTRGGREITEQYMYAEASSVRANAAARSAAQGEDEAVTRTAHTSRAYIEKGQGMQLDTWYAKMAQAWSSNIHTRTGGRAHGDKTWAPVGEVIPAGESARALYMIAEGEGEEAGAEGGGEASGREAQGEEEGRVQLRSTDADATEGVGDGVRAYVNGLLDRFSFNSKRVLNWLTLSKAVEEAGVFTPQTPAVKLNYTSGSERAVEAARQERRRESECAHEQAGSTHAQEHTAQGQIATEQHAQWMATRACEYAERVALGEKIEDDGAGVFEDPQQRLEIMWRRAEEATGRTQRQICEDWHTMHSSGELLVVTEMAEDEGASNDAHAQDTEEHDGAEGGAGADAGCDSQGAVVEMHAAAVGRGLRARKRAKAIGLLNVCGLRMERREEGGRRARASGAWGDGSDMLARPTAKTRKAVKDAKDRGVVVMVWVDTHARGDERVALEGYLQRQGWGAVGTDAYETESGQAGGGVIVAWDTSVMKKTGVGACDEVVSGRAVSARLTSLVCGAVVRVVGVYAPTGRRNEGASGGKTERETFWDDVQAWVEGDEEAILVGDVNAETEEALRRMGRAPQWQDTRWQRLVSDTGMCVSPTRAPTYAGVSEIDQIATGARAREYVSTRAECWPGTSESDHLMVRMGWVGRADAGDGEGWGEQRAKNMKLDTITKEQWAAYGTDEELVGEVASAVAQIAAGTPEDSVRKIQAIVSQTVGDLIVGPAPTDATDTSAQRHDAGKVKPSTAAQRKMVTIERWQGALAAARAWTGRRGTLARCAHARFTGWIRTQPEINAALRDVDHLSRGTRKETMVIVCEAGLQEAMRAAAISGRDEGDEIVVRIEEAMKKSCNGSRGGLYQDLFTILNAARGRGGSGGTKVTAVYKDGDKLAGEEVHGAGQVRAEARRQGETINKKAGAALGVVREIMRWADRGKRQGTPKRPAVVQRKRESSEKPKRKRGSQTGGGQGRERDWVDDVCTWERFKEGLKRTAAVKGVGCDGFNMHMMAKAPEQIQRAYHRALQEVVRQRRFPEEWSTKVAMMAMKPGEDPVDLSRRRDLWLECHAHKMVMWMLGSEWEEAAEWTVPSSQAGSARGRSTAEQSLVMRCQKEQCGVERTLCCRVYLDMATFYMSCCREVQWEAERWCGVRPEVTEVVKAMFETTAGKYETAYGLTESFAINNGNMQGCNQSPTRAKMHLRIIQEAVRKLCKGFRFRGAKESCPSMWYCDDGAFCVEDLATAQLVLDTCWMVTRAAGLRMQVKKDTKTAWQASYWKDGKEMKVDGWEMWLPDGRRVPQVKEEYTYLGSAESTKFEGAMEPVRKKVVRDCDQVLRLMGRVGVLGEKQLGTAMGLGVEGVVSHYGRSTPLGLETCDRIERTRAEVLAKRGIAAGTPRIQMHASVAAGGLQQRHAYQLATAALVDEVERVMTLPEDTPSRIAVSAHLRAECMRLGWLERGDVREWYPTHLENVLNEEMITEAWLMAKLRARMSTRVVGGSAKRGQRYGIDESEDDRERCGPPIWEEDERTAWQATRAGPCSVRVGLAPSGSGKVAVQAVPERSACAVTQRMRRLLAAGVREWADITSDEGEWRTWGEMMDTFDNLTDADAKSYKMLLQELGAGKWEGVVRQWRAVTTTPEWQTWAERRGDRGVEHGKTGTVQNVLRARDTAACLGGWEVLIDWGEDWAPTWESVKDIPQTAHVRHQVDMAKRHKRQATSWFEVLAGQEGVARAGARTKDETDRNRVTWQWQSVACNGRRVTAGEVGQAIRGDLTHDSTQRAMMKLWRAFLQHAYEVGGGEGEAERVNTAETPTKAAAAAGVAAAVIVGGDEAEGWGTAKTGYGSDERWCTWYESEERARVLADGAGGGRQQTKREQKKRPALAGEEGRGERVTVAEAQRRMAINARLREAGDERYPITPTAEPEKWLAWEGSTRAGRGDACAVWANGARGAAYAEMSEEANRLDPLMRMVVRSDHLEIGDGGSVRTADGVDVVLDASERQVLMANRGLESAQATRELMEVCVPLHVAHVLTDCWAVDGSVEKSREADGVIRRRAACGVYGGVRPLERLGDRESPEEWQRRCVAAGMTGARLPATYEVLDTELYAILMALEMTMAQDEPHLRTCMIMSDCESGMRMVESAWRHGVREHGDRAAVLEAICEARKRLRMCVFVQVPSHTGITPNAYADGVAKAYLRAELDSALVDERIERNLPEGRAVRTVHYREAGRQREVIWDVNAFEATREAVGAWIRHHELARIGRGKGGEGEAGGAVMVVDAGQLGMGWEERRPKVEEAIWAKAGAREPQQKKEHVQSAGSMTDVDVAGRTGAHSAGAKETPAQAGATDAARCGIVMAARAGQLWEVGAANRWGREDAGENEGAQGCPACCSRNQGWGWSTRGDGRGETGAVARRWAREGGGEMRHADLLHVVSGRCAGTPGRAVARHEIRAGIAQIRHAIASKRKGQWVLTARCRRMWMQILEWAGRSVRENACEGGQRARAEQAVMHLLAARAPPFEWTDGIGPQRSVENACAEGVKQVQRAAAKLREAWKEASSVEVARRAEREGGHAGMMMRRVGLWRWRKSVTDGVDDQLRQWRDSEGRAAVPAGEDATAWAKARARTAKETLTAARREPRWTMAAMLVAHLRASGRRRRASREREQTEASGDTSSDEVDEERGEGGSTQPSSTGRRERTGASGAATGGMPDGRQAREAAAAEGVACGNGGPGQGTSGDADGRGPPPGAGVAQMTRDAHSACEGRRAHAPKRPAVAERMEALEDERTTRRARLEQREDEWEHTEQGPAQKPARTATQHSGSSGDHNEAHRWTPGSDARSMEAPETQREPLRMGHERSRAAKRSGEQGAPSPGKRAKSSDSANMTDDGDGGGGSGAQAGAREERTRDRGGKRAHGEVDESATTMTTPGPTGAHAANAELSTHMRNPQTLASPINNKVARTGERPGREKRKATAEATERSQKEARASETAKERRGAKRKRGSGMRATVIHVDNGKGGDRSILRTITVSSVMVDRVVGDQYEWRDRSYREFTGRRGQIFDDGG